MIPPDFTPSSKHYNNNNCSNNLTALLGTARMFRSLLFNVGNSFSPNEAAINGSRRCALYPPCHCQCSVLRVFKAIATRIRGKSKQTLKLLKIEPGTSRSESRALAN